LNINGEFDPGSANAGGVLNTCKSDDDPQLAGVISGERVSNT